MGIDIVKVLGERSIPLPIVSDQVLPIGKEPIWNVQERKERRIVIQLDKCAVPRGVLGIGNALRRKQVFAVITVHKGAEQVPFSIRMSC